ncbi:MAG: rhodanese-like domain-containing protein [Bacteroidia bacterium]|nr:rhodanese-like domain-containing protein [Bacteroidia bacterium]
MFSSCSNGQTSGVKQLASAEFEQEMKSENAVIMDVRTPGEVAAGYIEGATLFVDFNAPGFEEKVSSLDKSKTYYIYCKSGGRSGNACSLMAAKGFKVVNLSGGINGWKGKTVK